MRQHRCHLARLFDSKGHVVVLLAPAPVQVTVSIGCDVLFWFEHCHSTKLGAIVIFVVELVYKGTQLCRLLLALVYVVSIFKHHVHIVQNDTVEPFTDWLPHGGVHCGTLVEVSWADRFRHDNTVLTTLPNKQLVHVKKPLDEVIFAIFEGDDNGDFLDRNTVDWRVAAILYAQLRLRSGASLVNRIKKAVNYQTAGTVTCRIISSMSALVGL